MRAGETTPRRLTQNGEEHRQCGEDPGQALTAHEESAVTRREEADHAEETALQHGAEHCERTQTRTELR